MTTTHPVAPHTMHEASPGAATSTSTVIYTCPMHPQIRQSRPGQCPICGMTLEPLLPLVEAEESAELKDFSRRFWSTLPLTLLALAVAMAHVDGHPPLLGLVPKTARRLAARSCRCRNRCAEGRADLIRQSAGLRSHPSQGS